VPARAPTADRGRRRRVALLAAVAAPAALAAIPAALSAAPAIATDAVCLRPSQQPNGNAVSPPLRMTGAGFTPGQVVPIQVGSRTWYTVVEDIGGFLVEIDVSDRLRLPRPKSSPLGIVATDPSLGPSNALRIRTAPLEFSATPKRTRPSNTVTFRFSGFEPGRAIFAHYRFDGRVRANVRMGRASNPCGLLTARRDQIPVRDPEIGLWRIQFDQRATFSPRATPRIGATVNVFPTSGD
jgi:hypothetical protein